MKLRHSQVTLLLAALTFGTFEAQGARGNGSISYGTLNTVSTDTVLTVDPSTSGMNPGKYAPYVKGGSATASVVASGTMNSALFVREGALNIGGSNQVTVTLTPTLPDSLTYVSTGAGTSFTVAGKDASVSLNNATLKSTVATSMVVGSPDGNGTLTITNGSLVDNHTGQGINFIIGAATSKTNHYEAHIHATKAGSSLFSGAYSSGTFTTMADGSTKIGAGYVTVSDDSMIFGGNNGLVLGEGSLTVTSDSSAYFGYDVGSLNADGVPGTPCGQAANYESSLGAIAGATSVVNITDGSSVNFGTGLKLGAFDGTNVTVNVGADSQLNMAARSSSAGKTYMGVEFSVTGSSLTGYDRTWDITDAAASKTKVNVTEGGSVNLQEVYMGHANNTADAETVSMNIDADSAFTAASLEMNNGAAITNNGFMQISGNITMNGGKLVNNGMLNGVVSFASTASGGTLTINGGEFVNTGSLGSAIEMTGGTLVAKDGSSIAGLTATGGTIKVEGDVFMSGDLVLDDHAALIFADDATIDLGGYDFVFNGGSIALTLSDSALTDVVLFTGANDMVDWSSLEVSIVDEEGNATGETVTLTYNENGTVSIVPEPATATLGLQALAAMAARRRRH